MFFAFICINGVDYQSTGADAFTFILRLLLFELARDTLDKEIYTRGCSLCCREINTPILHAKSVKAITEQRSIDGAFKLQHSSE